MNAISEIKIPSAAVPARDHFGAIEWQTAPLAARDLVARIIKLTRFSVGAVHINRGKGWLVGGYDLYGYDLERQLVAIQFRQQWKHKRHYSFAHQRTGYILAGIDAGKLFTHVMPSSYRRMHGLEDATPGDVIRWAESRIFRTSVARLPTIVRQGDIALVPVRSIPAKAVPAADQTSLTLRDSHEVLVDGQLYEAKDEGRYWVNGLVEIDHLPGQHRAIDAEGRFEIVLGVRGELDFVTANSAY
jgi:hypothetical protein